VSKVLSALILATVAILAGCDTTSLGTGGGGGGSHEIKYEITGSASSVDVTYQNENGDTSQESDVPVPWTKTFAGKDGQFVYISGQNKGESGDTTCIVYVDGRQKETNTSSGAYAICTASGTI
jgi:hypothetical protein